MRGFVFVAEPAVFNDGWWRNGMGTSCLSLTLRRMAQSERKPVGKEERKPPSSSEDRNELPKPDPKPFSAFNVCWA